MSTQLYEMEVKRDEAKAVSLTQFYGGQTDGKCLQLAVGLDAYVELTRDEVETLRNKLTNWLES